MSTNPMHVDKFEFEWGVCYSADASDVPIPCASKAAAEHIAAEDEAVVVRRLVTPWVPA